MSHALLPLTVLAIPPGNFEPSCTSTEDFGWPRFRITELQASPWASYFNEAYGTLPTKYPVCTYDLHVLDKPAFDAAGLNASRPIVDSKAVKEGDLFMQGALGFSGYGIYHAKWTAAANDTWIEVAHAVLPTEWIGAWQWRLRGTGMFVNVGKTKVFPTPADPAKVHLEAITWLMDGCSVKVEGYWPLEESEIFGLCAREKGLDSIQFEPQDGQAPIGTFGQTGLTELVLTRLSGNKTCGVPDASATPLRTGWMASSECDCANQPIPPTCGLMPFAPPSIPKKLVYPALCAAQAKNASVPCEPVSCDSYVTACRRKRRAPMLTRQQPFEWTGPAVPAMPIADN